ncbi:glutamine-hydrolyzing GMP synthase [Williamsoniiplasma lucivorax]|uniref:GMP synthase [glutamine-hydrolyzing] n=1 Tax=Williamsoniiplasma lucivorax TaxID=209274 RepID=A0A2S5RD61_9MOLU|nr:glutamine-hydrolyzing GMP synthase [Williamsoniiplasma lucivorax]PPE05224.1 GMP synthase [Williamsoniiplasma lucivorax]
MHKTQIIILDFGSQYTQLLARRIRELNVYVEVVDYQISAQEIKEFANLKGIIFSGGPASAYDATAYQIDHQIYSLNLPILGICYGMQLLAHDFNGVVSQADKQEFGKAMINITKPCLLTEQVPPNSIVWMSHADHIDQMPTSFEVIGTSNHSIALIKHKTKPFYGIQFHPEVTQSEFGLTMLSNFIFQVCQSTKDWFISDFITDAIKDIQQTVGQQHVVLGLSGGVDSSVSAALIQKAIGHQLTCVFVDHGLLRKNEADEVIGFYEKHFDMKIVKIDASEMFFKHLKGVVEPEAKRKVIGKLFIDVFMNYIEEHNQEINFLAQGTIYPDIIESSKKGHSSKTIKSHHNVGGLPKNLKLTLLEPIKDLFKDEVRQVGKQLGIDDKLINRHPFPGPGLGIRIIGEVTRAKCDLLREVDAIFIEELHKNDLYNHVSQAFATLLPVKTVGVMGDNRTYDSLVALRSVNTIDFMTAQATHLPWDFIDHVVSRIINEVDGVNRVVYDVTSKPPGTIEWE